MVKSVQTLYIILKWRRSLSCRYWFPSLTISNTPSHYILGLWCLLEIISRLSVEVMRAVGQGGERDCTLLYSLRFLPERLQAVAPGCNHFALATWIHRHSDPWLTLQSELSRHTLPYFIIACANLVNLLSPLLWSVNG